MALRAFEPDQLFRALAQEGGTPKLTWYGEDYERIELSGAVLTNWLNKTTNLLAQEFDAEPDFTIAIDLPVHWRTLVWTLAALRTGSTIAITSQGATPKNEVQLTVSTSPTQNWNSEDLVLVTLGALARAYPGELPAGATDAAQAVMTYSDSLGFVPPAELDSTAITCTAPQANLSYEDLGAWIHDGASLPKLAKSESDQTGSSAASPQRTLITVASNEAATVLESIRLALGLWTNGGSVVLCSASMSAELTVDAARLDRISSSERITDHINI